VRGLGCPARIILTAGHRSDVPQAAALLGADRPSVVMGDTAYDADHFRAAIAAAGAIAFIPNNPSRASKLPFDAALYKERHLVECYIGKLKQFRRIATRYEETARNYLAVVLVAAIVLWLR
jgi:transposase